MSTNLRMSRAAALAAVVLAVSIQQPAAAEKKPSADAEPVKFSYAVGFQLGSMARKQASGLDAASAADGMRDAITNGIPRYSMDEMGAVIAARQKLKREKALKAADDSAKRGAEFLAANGKKEGVKTTDSGLQYKVIKAGTGAQPSEKDKVSVHYRGTLMDGKEFDSSYKRGEPVSFPVTGVIKGWQEALQLMKVGGKWQVFIPAALGYGANGKGPIGPNQMLIFDIELLDIKT